jgi:hypothetical protein
MVDFTLDKLDQLLRTLQGLPRLREVQALKKRLEQEKKKIQKPIKPIIPKPKVNSNRNRSTKLKRYWRYVKKIRDNFPNQSIQEIRVQLTQRQQGKETKIPDAIWQNPSP